MKKTFASLAGSAVAAMCASFAAPGPRASSALLAAAGFLVLATPAYAAATNSERFAAYLDAAYQRTLRADPALATAQGERTGLDRWEDLSEAGATRAAAAARAEVAGLRKAVRYRALGPREQLQYRVFAEQQQLLLDRWKWRDHLYPLNPIVGPHVDVVSVLSSQPIASVADAEAYVRRIVAVRPYFAGLVERLERQTRAGVWLPKSIYPILISQARGVIAGRPHGTEGESPILADFRRKVGALSLPDAQRDALIASATAALTRDLEPAYRDLIRTLESQGARTPIDGGVWQLPDGAQFYAFLLRQFTTTSISAKDVHALGLREVERIHGEMTMIARSVGHAGDLRSFLQNAKKDPRFYLADDDAGRTDYLARANAIVAAMQAKLPEAFLRPPPLPLEIRATEPYRANGAPNGFYESGTPDGSRPGVVWLNLSSMKSNPLYDLEWLLYHEGVPGHHLQIASILSDPSIPKLRKVERWWQDSAFVEGWALYAERLGKELGFYRDPYSDFGRLSGELWRATRLVVDSGLHWKRWTRAQAIAYLDENTPSSHAANEQAVDRYLAVPGQATAFTIGMHTIVEERERAKRELGHAFDLREYHAAVLENGYVPLWAMRESVAQWVARPRPSASTPAVAAACAPTPEAALSKFLLAFNSLDWPTFSACLADDVTLFNPDVPGATSLHRLDGREAVERSFRGVFDVALSSTPSAGPNIQPEHLTVRRDGDLAVATFEFARGEGAFGRRTVVLVRRSDGWQISHIHGSNVRAMK